MTPSDDDLLISIRARNAGAFEALAARHRETLRRHLIAIVREADVAEDLLQETLLRAWTRADQWDGRGAVKAWLFRIATNLALNFLRDQKRRREQPLEPTRDVSQFNSHFYADDEPPVPAWMIDTAALGPDQVAQQQADVARLWHLVDALPDDKQAVLRLVVEEERELRDVANLLDIPEGTVKSRLYHARKHLARQWHAAQEDEA